MNEKIWRSALFPLVIIAVLIWLAVQTLGDSVSKTEKLRFSDALVLARQGKVTQARFTPETHEVRLTFATGRRGTTIYPVEQSAYQLEQLLEEKGIPYEAQRVGRSVFWSLVTSLLPFLLLIVFWVFLMRSVRGDLPKAQESQETSFLR